MSDTLHIGVGGGKTGGHAIPAINITGQLAKRLSVKVTYIGLNNSIEQRLALQEGYTFKAVPISYLRRSISLRNLLLPLQVVISVLLSIWYLLSEKVHIVIVTGGFSAFPVGAAARLMGLPYVLQEQNACPGLVNKLLASRASRIYLGYPAAAKRLKCRAERIMVTGNPVSAHEHCKSIEEARREFGIDPRRKTIFVIGGSSGAMAINITVFAMLNELNERGINIIWQGRSKQDDGIEFPEEWKGRLAIEGFMDRDRMYTAYRAANFVISRSGAMTLAELAFYGIPAILIPYPHATDGHQEANARELEDAGAAIVVLNDDLMKDTLLSAVDKYLQKDELRRARDAMKTFGKPDALQQIADDIVALVS